MFWCFNKYCQIYPGANGTFTLYEDENDTYNYEKGQYATVTFSLNDKNRKLTISARKGNFPGMLNKRTFNIVLVGEGHGVGLPMAENADKTIVYDGKSMSIDI